MKNCLKTTKILLPNESIELSKWAVVACDQFTSQPEYWEEVQRVVGDVPSMLHLILPEAYLGKSESKLQAIHHTMQDYMEEGILGKVLDNSFVLTIRITQSGTRIGLVGAIDLDEYDFTPQSTAQIRATEETIMERIPPRIKIREGAILESPHIILLYDNEKCDILEPLYEECVENCEPLYDFELMQEGGHITGFQVDGKRAQKVMERFEMLQEKNHNLLFVVGDGNHSLATAKTHWENMKKVLTEEEQKKHPAKYALVEVVNLHSEAIQFEPIHRVLFHADWNELMHYLEEQLECMNMGIDEGDEFTIFDGSNTYTGRIVNRNNRLPVEILQKILDQYVNEHKEVEIDYIHGEEALRTLADGGNAVAVRLESIQKGSLFSGICEGGVLPRKTFSIGSANEKRYYLECRTINYMP